MVAALLSLRTKFGGLEQTQRSTREVREAEGSLHHDSLSAVQQMQTADSRGGDREPIAASCRCTQGDKQAGAEESAAIIDHIAEITRLPSSGRLTAPAGQGTEFPQRDLGELLAKNSALPFATGTTSRNCGCAAKPSRAIEMWPEALCKSQRKRWHISKVWMILRHCVRSYSSNHYAVNTRLICRPV